MEKEDENIHRYPIRFPLDDWKGLEDMAKEENRSINMEVLTMVRDYIARKKTEANLKEGRD